MKTRIRIFLFTVLVLSAFAHSADTFAAQYDLKQMTPAVEQAIASRSARYEQLQNLKSQGVAGENNRGYVEVLQAGAGAEGLVQAENSDRKTIYHTIAEQNGLGATGLGVVETIFSEVQREKARAGDPLQQPTGEWVRK